MATKKRTQKNLAADWSAVFPPLPNHAKDSPSPLATRPKKRPALGTYTDAPNGLVAATSLRGTQHDVPRLKGLSLRQPWAEQVMRGAKNVEYRQRPVKHRGRIYIYASLGRYPREEERDFAEEVGYTVDDLPRGVVVGTVEIVDCTGEGGGDFAWHLANPVRLGQPMAPVERPQPIWFHPFGRP